MRKSKNAETLFIKDYLINNITTDLQQFRVTFILFIVIYSAFALFDMQVSGSQKQIIMTIRFLIVVPYFIMAFVFSFTKTFIKASQFVISLGFVMAGVATSIMLYLMPVSLIHYGGMFIIFFAGFFLVNLYYKYAVISYLLIMSFTAVQMIGKGDFNMQSIYILILYACAGVIGIMGSFCLFRYKYLNYLNTRALIKHEKQLETLVDEKVEEITKSQIATIYALARIVEARDKCTGTHIENVCGLCSLLAMNIADDVYEAYKLDKSEFVKTIEIASALHDIGKVAIDDQILNKPAKLTDKEFLQIKKHPEIGSQNLEYIYRKYNNTFINMGIDITRYHHERWDGKGYPMGLKGNQIPLSAQIMAIADVYDALTSDRPYKLAFTHEKAYEIMTKEEKGHFNPYLVEIFEKIHPAFKKMNSQSVRN